MYRLLISFLLTVSISGCNSHYYNEDAISYAPEIKKILVSNHKCKSIEKCNLMFLESGAWIIAGRPYGGVYITIYEINEPEIITSILTFITYNHAKHKEVKTTVKIYSTPHLAKSENIVAELIL